MTCDEFRQYHRQRIENKQKSREAAAPLVEDEQFSTMAGHIGSCKECRTFLIEQTDTDKLLRAIFGEG